MGDDAPWTDPVVVPDDIRSLQADVDAYHREQRAARRGRSPLRRLLASPVVRHWGPLVAILMSAVTVASVAFLVLTLGDFGRRPPALPAPVSTAPATEAGAQGGLLPDIVVRDHASKPISLRSLRPAVVALLPLRCDCAELVANLAGQANEVGMQLVVVAPAATDAEVAALPGRTHRGHVTAVFDPEARLAGTYLASNVTVLVVAPDAVVTYLQRDVPRDVRLEPHLFAATTSARAGGQR